MVFALLKKLKQRVANLKQFATVVVSEKKYEPTLHYIWNDVSMRALQVYLITSKKSAVVQKNPYSDKVFEGHSGSIRSS